MLRHAQPGHRTQARDQTPSAAPTIHAEEAGARGGRTSTSRRRYEGTSCSCAPARWSPSMARSRRAGVDRRVGGHRRVAAGGAAARRERALRHCERRRPLRAARARPPRRRRARVSEQRPARAPVFHLRGGLVHFAALGRGRDQTRARGRREARVSVLYPRPAGRRPGPKNNPCKPGRADARTRTGDPFITSFEPLSPPVTSSHRRSFPAPKLPDSR
jgi:hypothetical protein